MSGNTNRTEPETAGKRDGNWSGGTKRGIGKTEKNEKKKLLSIACPGR